ncbi:MAG: hypothetical protein R3F59_26035 [Myxococcota bacterium]
MLVSLLALGSALDARGATPVIHDDTADADAVSAVAERTGLPASQLSSVRLDSLLQAAPGTLGDAVLRRCTQQPSAASQVSAEVARAEAAWAKGDESATMDHLDLAVGYAGCLSELVEPAPAARAFRLRAEVALAQGDPDSAEGELATALSLQPSLAWTVEGGEAVLEAAKGRPAFPVQVLPPNAATGPWIDGQVATDGRDLRQGVHLLQFSSPAGIRTAFVVVGGPATVVVPTNYRRPVLDRIGDDGRRAEVEGLVAAVVPDFFAAYVLQAGGIWLVSDQGDGTVATTTVVEPAPPPPPEDDGKKRKKKRKDRKRR